VINDAYWKNLIFRSGGRPKEKNFVEDRPFSFLPMQRGIILAAQLNYAVTHSRANFLEALPITDYLRYA